MAIAKVCVVGAGTMGHGIALVCAQGGLRVGLVDVKEEFVQNGMDKVKKFLQGGLERKKLTQQDYDNILGRFQPTTDLAKGAGDADLVIEAIIEDTKIKIELYKRLDAVCPPQTVYATNTSYQSVTELAAGTKRPDRFIGMHWFNPPPIMRGIEVIKTDKTNQTVINDIMELCRKLGKDPALVIDSPGFIANRLLQVWRNEGLRMMDERAATMQDVDGAIKQAYNFRMGPFELADLSGMDVVIAGNETMLRETGSELFRPPRCLVLKVRGGDLGRKTGRGFYEYK